MYLVAAKHRDHGLDSLISPMSYDKNTERGSDNHTCGGQYVSLDPHDMDCRKKLI